MNRRRILTFLPILLLFLLSTNFDSLYRLTSPPPPDPVTAYSPLLNKPEHLSQRLTVERKPLLSPPVTESVLFPDWFVFVLLIPDKIAAGDRNNLSCLFSNGDTSAANYSGRIPSSARDGFLCKMPGSVQRLRPFYTPKLIVSGSTVVGSGSDRMTEMMRWNRLAYESMSTADDVIVFAKGVNRNQGRDRPARDITCVFSANGAVTAVTNATVSAQEVFRCPHPAVSLDGDVRVSVKIASESSAIPSVAVYRREPANGSREPTKPLTCACTMVYNVAKFLREWVSFHSAIGIDRFVLYDNGSDDDLSNVLTQLADDGFDVSAIYWPWQKTQEAGFSHCAAAAHVSSNCAWMAFLDVDEFLYSPSWAGSAQPNKTMIRSIIGPDSPTLGQVQLTCVDFGPSSQRAHPPAGVTQGYTCRVTTDRNRQRHKSIVKPEAVWPTLKNSVHHFGVGPGWDVRKARANAAVVNHYKYQAWGEFRKKFRRRVSAYVADWTERRNAGSRDRTPGLGFTDDVEPEWWAQDGCERRDEGLRRVVERWFKRSTGRFDWEL